MQHRTVRDLMTHAVVTARPDTTFKEIARLLADHDVSGVPVVDSAGHPLGVVSEGDLLRRESAQADPTGRLLAPPLSPEQRSRVEATTAEGLMTRPAVTARPEWSVIETVRIMEDHGVKRLPVVDERDVLVGVVSRADLLGVFLRRDPAIHEEIVEDVLVRTLGEVPTAVRVTVDRGRVTLRGTLGRRSLVPILVRLCRSVDGVIDVRNHLDYEVDDTVPHPA